MTVTSHDPIRAGYFTWRLPKLHLVLRAATALSLTMQRLTGERNQFNIALADNRLRMFCCSGIPGFRPTLIQYAIDEALTTTGMAQMLRKIDPPESKGCGSSRPSGYEELELSAHDHAEVPPSAL